MPVSPVGISSMPSSSLMLRGFSRLAGAGDSVSCGVSSCSLGLLRGRRGGRGIFGYGRRLGAGNLGKPFACAALRVGNVALSFIAHACDLGENFARFCSLHGFAAPCYAIGGHAQHHGAAHFQRCVERDGDAFAFGNGLLAVVDVEREADVNGGDGEVAFVGERNADIGFACGVGKIARLDDDIFACAHGAGFIASGHGRQCGGGF